MGKKRRKKRGQPAAATLEASPDAGASSSDEDLPDPEGSVSPPTTSRGGRRLVAIVLVVLLVVPASAWCLVHYLPRSEVASERQGTAPPLATTPQDAARRDSASPVGSGSHSRAAAVTRQTPSSRDEELGTLRTPKSEALRAADDRDADPREDGWETEAISNQANAQLKRIGKLLEHPEKLSAAELSEVVTEDFSCGPLRAGDLRERFRDRAVTILQTEQAPSAETEEAVETYRGAAGLAEALRELAAGLDGAGDVHVKFKLFRVNPGEDAFTTTAYYLDSGHVTGGAVQQNATWNCRWIHGSGDAPPRLASIEVSDYEKVVVRSPSETLFADCTEAVLGHVPAFRDQLSHGTVYWKYRIDQALEIYLFGFHGLAVGDVNGDALEDVYVCQPGGLPNRLFVQQPDGTLEDVSAESGTDILDLTRSALLVDVDNDGDQDLVVSVVGHVMVQENDGQGRFTLRVAQPVERTAHSMAAADYDQDGDLDIYACAYYARAEDVGQLAIPFPYHDANNGGRNTLLRNEGNWQFSDATAETGFDVHNRRFSFSASWEDYDNDGDLDLYVANDFGHNNLFRNDDGKFTDVAVETGAVDQNFGMSVSWGDYNRDGWMDLYVSNMFSAAGNRIVARPQFKNQATAETKAIFQRFAEGNTLLANAGDGTFRDVSFEAGATMGRWSWGSMFADINNDGWPDVLVANGYLTGENPDDL